MEAYKYTSPPPRSLYKVDQTPANVIFSLYLFISYAVTVSSFNLFPRDRKRKRACIDDILIFPPPSFDLAARVPREPVL